MSQEILQQLGFSQNEAKIYKALLVLKKANVSQIALYTSLYRRNAYDGISRLVEKDVAYPILQSREKLYAPVLPEKLLDMVRLQESELAGILPSLQKKYFQRVKPQEAYIYRGHEGFKNYLRDIVRVGKDVYFIGGKLAWFDERLTDFRKQFFKEAREKGIRFFTIFDAEVKEKGAQEVREFRAKPKFMPKKYATDSLFVIFGDYVVAYAGSQYKRIRDDITLYVLKDKDLAESYRVWFRFMYDFCPE